MQFKLLSMPCNLNRLLSLHSWGCQWQLETLTKCPCPIWQKFDVQHKGQMLEASSQHDQLVRQGTLTYWELRCWSRLRNSMQLIKLRSWDREVAGDHLKISMTCSKHIGALRLSDQSNVVLILNGPGCSTVDFEYYGIWILQFYVHV